MPIYLPPLSRRQFIRRSLAAALGLGLAPNVSARGKSTDPDSWALLADTHLAADRSKTARGINMTDHFLAVSHELCALSKRPAGVIITGDCAFNSGEIEDYAALVDLLRDLRGEQMPIHLALGNHDHRDHFREVLGKEQPADGHLPDKQVAIFRSSHANWFVLDSLETTMSTPGFLGREQLDWLASSLDANRSKPALVMVHHNPGISGNIGLKDSPALFEVIRPRKQVKAYIYGHTHTWKI